MRRSTYQAGETTASRIKTLAIYLERAKGAAEADALLRSIKLSRDDIEDETRPIGVELWHRAVEAFASRYGRDELLATWQGVVAPDNLAVWNRVLRSTNEPLDAFKQLNGLGGEEVRTSRWETLGSGPGRWHGRVSLVYDPRFERDGLLSLARAAELRAIPVLFGFPAAQVTQLAMQRGTFASRTGATGQEYEVTWGAPSEPRRIPIGAAIGAALGASGFVHSPTVGAATVAVLTAVGAGVGLMLGREQVRKAEAAAQKFRLQALERNMALRDDRQRAQAGFTEGTVIAGLYRLGPLLGSGGSGVIHLASRLSDGANVAIKLLRSAIAHDEVAADRLRREAEAMGLAWHPNVVELLDHGTLPDGTIYLVMEYLEGESLATRLRRKGRLSLEETTPIVLQLCDALAAIHAAGVIHRDVKPGNIFLVEGKADGGAERVKLLDFGIARVEWAETRLTQVDAPLGTPGYMSPEQEAGKEIDARADLYALGAVMVECLLGPERDRQSINDEASKPSSGVHRSKGELPEALEPVVARAMAQRPRDRYPDAKTMRDAITSALELRQSGGQGAAGQA